CARRDDYGSFAYW
nr:immunoglobulin heavy chain junction region [Mus musculus]